MNARRAAFKVLMGLEQTPKRLEKLLDQELDRNGRSDERDRALAVNLVYKVLRHRLWLDYLLSHFVKRPLQKLDPEALTVLRIGAADLTLMRTPDHAAVHAAVELAKATPAKRAQGLVNGTLRSMTRGWQNVKLPGKSGSLERLSVEHSHPKWLVEELMAICPPEELPLWLQANQAEPPSAIRVNTLKASIAEVIDLLAPSLKSLEAHSLAPESLMLKGVHGPARDLPGFSEGLWQSQDPGASALSRLLGVEPGMRVLDLCAGAGGKTGHLAALMQDQGELVAVEPSKGRARGLGFNLQRLGVSCAKILQCDGREVPSDIGSFDRIIIDAPCTGLGVVGRRPDVRWRRTRGDANRLAILQLELCRVGAHHLKPDGAMLYCTCTVTRSENEQVIEALFKAEPKLKIQWDLEAAGPSRLAIGEDGLFRTKPHLNKCDAFFGVRLAGV
jgi:16S rRNA (cytosine967-C5)-methyltransferase